jgi:hypothetical protein
MALRDEQKREKKFLTKRGRYATSVTTNDASSLDLDNSELFIGTGGDIKVDLSGGSTVILKNISSGTYLRGIYVDKVYRTGTTARDIVAIY